METLSAFDRSFREFGQSLAIVGIEPRACLVMGALLVTLGCGRDVGIAEVADVGFIESADSAGEEVTQGDASSGSCSVGSLDSCPMDRLCCDMPAERCVPSADGVHQCVESGTVAVGERCGEGGIDECVFGALCASSGSEERARCRAICASSSDCSAGTCVVALELGGETIRLCE